MPVSRYRAADKAKSSRQTPGNIKVKILPAIGGGTRKRIESRSHAEARKTAAGSAIVSMIYENTAKRRPLSTRFLFTAKTGGITL